MKNTPRTITLWLIITSTLLVISVFTIIFLATSLKNISTATAEPTPNTSFSSEVTLSKSGNYEIIGSEEEGYGDLYYIGPNEYTGIDIKTLISTSKTVSDSDITSYFDTIRYTDVELSPNEEFLLISAGCWESPCYRVYEIGTGNLYWTTHYGSVTKWTEDNKLRTDGQCVTPRVVECPISESISAEEPWKMQELEV